LDAPLIGNWTLVDPATGRALIRQSDAVSIDNQPRL
jgi:hypothetical protein